MVAMRTALVVALLHVGALALVALLRSTADLSVRSVAIRGSFSRIEVPGVAEHAPDREPLCFGRLWLQVERFYSESPGFSLFGL